MTDEMILVPREELLAWAKAWLNDYDPNDGTDCVTPFDTYLLKTPVEVPSSAPVEVGSISQRVAQLREAIESEPENCFGVSMKAGRAYGVRDNLLCIVGLIEQALSAQQSAYDGGFSAADMMDARKEGRKEAELRRQMVARDYLDGATQTSTLK